MFYVNADGKEIFQTFSKNPKGYERFGKILSKDDAIAVEATSFTQHFKGLFHAKVAKFTVVNTKRFKHLQQNVKKTDRHDARMLALFLEKDLLPECRERSQREHEVIQVSGVIDRYLDERTKEKNSIQGIYASQGIDLGQDALSSRKKLDALDLEPLTKVNRMCVKSHRDTIIFLDGKIKDLKAELAELSEDLPGYKEVAEITGVGNRSSSRFTAHIGNPADFNEKSLAAYVGLVPIVSQSAGRCHHGHITKQGNGKFRKALVQCARVAIRHNDYLKSFYQRVARRRGHHRAIVAAARKLLIIIHRVLVEVWTRNANAELART